MFMVQCTNKGCRKLSQALLEKKTNKVFCSDCHQELEVTIFVKNQLKHFKQFIELNNGEGKSFILTCTSCQNKSTPKFENEKFHCASCNSEIKSTTHFMNLFKASYKPNA